MKSDFVVRYAAVIEACARFIHNQCARGEKFVTTTRLSEYIAHSLPTLYRQTFGNTPKRLKSWRVKTMISNAVYLGAFDVHDVASVRGRGFKPATKARLKRVA